MKPKKYFHRLLSHIILLVGIIVGITFCGTLAIANTWFNQADGMFMGFIFDAEGLWPTQYSAIVNQVTGMVDFQITFNKAPDFFTINNAGSQANTFQFYIDPNATGPNIGYGDPFNVSSLIRGGEIHISGDIRVRDAYGEGGPDSGGWGPIRGSVPYILDGDVLIFSTPLAIINDPDGQFGYYLGLYVYGRTGAELFGQSGVDYLQSLNYPPNIPVPGSLLLLGSGLLGLAGWRRFKNG